MVDSPFAVFLDVMKYDTGLMEFCQLGLVPVAHTGNSSYLGAAIRRILVQSQPRQILRETLS
jgi:hypothetical protein